MSFQRPDVPVERGLASRVVGCLGCLEKIIQRRLGVDRDLSPARQMHRHVGPAAVADGGLLVEVAVLGHAGQLGDVAQRDLSPAPADLRALERGGQRSGFLLEAAGGLRQQPNLLIDSRVGVHAFRLELQSLLV